MENKILCANNLTYARLIEGISSTTFGILKRFLNVASNPIFVIEFCEFFVRSIFLHVISMTKISLEEGLARLFEFGTSSTFARGAGFN